MPNIQHKRGTRAALDALAASSGLVPWQVYAISDESRLALALTTSTYQTFLKTGEASGGGAGYYVGPTAPDPATYPLWFNTTAWAFLVYVSGAWVEPGAALDPDDFVPRAGGVTMTGPLSVPAGASGDQVPRRSEVVGITGNESISGVKTFTSRPKVPSGATLDEVPQAQEIPAIVRAFMHTAVSQSGGTPTGGIVEYGANANGTYWRLSNRLQICITSVASGVTSALTGTAGIYMSAAASQTWPAVFAATPEVSVSARNSATANCWAGDCVVSATGISALRAFSTINMASTVLSVTAIGRWY